MVVVPFARDQLEVARRVEAAGVGVRLPKRWLRGDRLTAAVEEARSRRDAARRMAGLMAATGGDLTAADAIEGLVATASPARSA